MNSLVRNGFLPTTVEINSLGIGFANIDNLYKLDMSDDEYLVVGERHNPTASQDPLDTKYNMIVNSDGVAVNASRRVYNTINNNLGKSAGLYVDNNIVCAGNIHAKGLVLDNITISDEINPQVLDNFIKQINAKDQPFQPGFRAYIPDITGSIANVDNIYTSTYITLGGFTDTFSNAYPLNIVETANNTINNIHVCMKNDVSNEGEAAAFRLGIIGGSNISPAVISTTEGMPLEFHVSIGSTAVNSVYGNKPIPVYAKNVDLPAMTIDARRNVGIGTNVTNEYSYTKLSMKDQELTRTINTSYANLEVNGLGVMKEIMVYDYYTKQFQHLDDIYIRARGMTLYAGQIGGGIFNDYTYTFYYDLNVNQLLTVRNLTVNETTNVNILNVSRLTVNNMASFVGDTYFNDSVYFQEDLNLNKNLNINSGDIFYNGKRINILDTEPIFLDPSIIEENNITNNSVLVFAQNDVVNLSGNNITFPGRVGIGIKDTDSYAEQLNVIKRNSTTFELMLQDSSDEDKNATPCTAFLGHLTELNPADNSLIINTNKHPTILNNIYFYPAKDLDRKNVVSNGMPVLTVHQNKRVGINIMNPQYELDVAGHIACEEVFVRRNSTPYKAANFLYSNDQTKRYFNIYDPLSDRYCINYNYITSTRDLKGFNVRKGINADAYYENNILTEQLKAAGNTGFYTNKKIAIGWANEKITASLQVRNVTTESNNYSTIRVYRGKRGGGRENNADYSGFDICDFETELPFQDRNNFRWFMYKNHLNKIGTDDKKRVGPLQFGYMDNAIVPNTFGMTMFYTPDEKSYHIDINNPNVDFGFKKDTALSVYGDLEVHGNINIVDSENKGFNYKINGINYSSDAISQVQQAQQAPNTSEILFGGNKNKNDIVINAEKIVLMPNNTTLIGYADDWFLNYANKLQTLNGNTYTPLIVYQKNKDQAVARFVSTGHTDYIKSSSAIEIGTYNSIVKNNEYIKNMVEFKVSGFQQNANTLLQLSSFDKTSKCYTPFISFYHNNLRSYTHIGNYAAHNPDTGEVFLQDTTLHIDDMNKYGVQITNRDDAAAINLHRSYADSNLYYIIKGCDDNLRFSIAAGNSPFDSYNPSMTCNTFVIDALDEKGLLRNGARYGFNADAPSDSFTINSVYDESSVKITNRYTEKLLFNQASAITIVNSNLLLQVHDVFDIGQVNYGKYMFTWNNDTSTYYTGIKYVMDTKTIPDIDNTCNIIFDSYKNSSNFVVNSNIVLNKSAAYTTVHDINIDFYSSNLDISYSKNEIEKFVVIDESRFTSSVRTFQSSNCLIDMAKKFDIIPIIDSGNPNISISIDENDLVKERIFEMQKTLQIPFPNSIGFTSNYTFNYAYSNIYTIPQYLVPYSVVVASSVLSMTCNLISTNRPELNSNFFNIHNNIHTYLKQPTGQLVDTVYNRHRTYIDTNIELIGVNGIYNNIFLITTTSNTVLYNEVQYNGNYVAQRTNYLNVEASMLIPETIVAVEEERKLEIKDLGINLVRDVVNNKNISNIYFETNTKTLTNRPLGLIEIYDYTDRIVKRDIHYEVYDDAFVILNNAFVNKVVISDYHYVYDFENQYNYFDDYYNKFHLNVNRIRYQPHLTLINYVDLDKSDPNDVDNVHKIYSYDGNFEIFLEKKEGYKDSLMRINEKGDAVIRNSLTTNDLIIDGFIYDKLGNNLLKYLNDDFSNQFSEIYTNKYYLNSSNIKIETTGSNGFVLYSSQRDNLDDINYNVFTVYESDGYNDYNLFSIQKGGKITMNREEDARYDVDIYGTTYSTEFISEVVYTSNLLVYGSNATIMTPMYNFNRVAIENYHEGLVGDEATLKIVSRGQQNVLEVYCDNDATQNIAMTVSEDGMLGINMLDPKYNLDVLGNTHVSALTKTSNLEVYGDDTTIHTRMLTSNFVKITNSSGYTALKVNNAGTCNILELFNHDSNVLTASKKGYLGIGLDKHDPEYVVDICGDLRIDRPYGEIFVNSDFYYQFRNELLLTYDSAGKNDFMNYGGVYEYIDKKNSVMLDASKYMMFKKDDWIEGNDLTISGWFRIDGSSADDLILSIKEISQFIVMMFPREQISSNPYTDSEGRVIQTKESSYLQTTTDHTAQYMFDDLYYGDTGYNEKFGWISAASKYVNASGLSTNTGSYFKNDSAYFGEWVMIDLGESIVLDRYKLYLFNGYNRRMPRTFRIYASDNIDAWNDLGNNSWDVVDERDDVGGWIDGTYKEFHVNQTLKSYRYIALLVHRVQTNGDGYCQITQMEIFGKTSIDLYNDLLVIKNNGDNTLSYMVNDTVVCTHEYIPNVWFHLLWNVLNSGDFKSFVLIDNKLRYEYDKELIVSDIYVSSSNIYRNYVGASDNLDKVNVAEFRVVSENLTGKMQNDIYNPPVITTVEDRVGMNMYYPDAQYKLDVNGNIHTNALMKTHDLLVYGNDATIKVPTLIENMYFREALKIDNRGAGNVLQIYDDSMIVLSIPKKEDISELNRIGINVLDPRYTLDLLGDAYISELLMTSNFYVYGDDMTVDSSILSSNFVKITNDSEHPALKVRNYGASNAFEVFDDNRSALIVTRGGNVGINTYYPAYDLDVIGDMHVSSLIKAYEIEVYGGQIVLNTPTFNSNYIHVVNDGAYPTYKISSYGSSNAFEVYDENRAALIITKGGNVGINTYYPKYDLEVIGDVRVSQTLYSSNIVIYGENTTLNTVTYQSEKMEIVSETEGPALTIKQNGLDHMLHVYDDDDIVFAINNTRKVGINMMDPQYDLDVTGDVNVRMLLQTSNFWVYGDDMKVDSRILSSNFVKIRNESDHPALKVQNYGTSNAFEVFAFDRTGMVINNEGRIGINTYVPHADVDVIGNVNVSNYNNYTAMKVRNYGTSNAFEVFAFDRTGMVINNEGRIGINTYVAHADVDVIGNVNVSNYNNYAAMKVRNYGTSNAFEVFDDERVGIVIKKGGNVGINTYTPEYDLQVFGVTESTYFKGDGSNLYKVNFLDRDTSMLVEGSNLYYTAERAGAVAEGSNVHASNLVYNVSNLIKDDLDALARFVDNISLQTGLGNVVVEYDYAPCMHYMFDDDVLNNGVLTDIGDGGSVRYNMTIMTAGSATNNTLTKVSGYKSTAVYTEDAYLWTYGFGSVATSANSPYLIYNADVNNLQSLLNSFHMCNGFTIHFIMKKNIAVGSTKTCEVLMFANGTNYANRLIRAVMVGSYLRFYVGSTEYAYTLIDSDVWYVVDLVCKISSDYSTMSLFIYLNGDYNKSMNAINRPYSSLSKADTTGLGFLIAYNLQNTVLYETSSTLYLENMQIYAKAVSLEEIDGLVFGIESTWKGSSGFAPNGSNIYFPYGSVGIGTHNPKADFHVVGNALVEMGDLYKKTQVNIPVAALPDVRYDFNVTTGLNPYNSSTYAFADNGTYGMPLLLNGFTNGAANNVLSSANGYTANSYAYPSAYTWSSAASGVYLYHNNPRNTSLFLDNIDNTGFTMHFVVRRTNATGKIIPIFFVGLTDSGLNMIYVSIGADNKVYFKSRSKSKVEGTDTYIEDVVVSDLDIIASRWYIIDIVFEVSGGTSSINMFIRDTSDGKIYTTNKIIDFFEKFDIDKILKTGYVYRWETASGAYDDRFENIGTNNLMYAIGYHPKEGDGGTPVSISDCSIQDFRIYYDALVSSEIDKLKTGSVSINEITTSIRENYGVERWKSSDGYYTNATKFITYTDGNVGIGTNDPSTYNLFIYKASNANNLIRIATDGTTTNAIAGVMMTKSNSDTTGFSMRYDRTADKLYFSTQDGTQIYTNRVTVQNDGNVGIGAGAPRGKLDIYNGNVVVRTTGEGDSAAIYLATPFDTNNSAMKCAIIAEGISNFSKSKLHFCLDDTADNTTTYNASVSNARMTIIPSGNVGIGKTDPGHKLHVEGTVNITNDTTIAGDLAVNGGDITTTTTGTFSLINANASTVNFAGAATTLSIGAASGTTTIKNANVVLDGDLAVNGGDITTNKTAFNLVNATATTVNFAGSATTLSVGAASGTATIKNANVVLDGDLAVNGGDITTNQTSFNLVNATATTVNFAGSATSINIGSSGATAVTNINSDTTIKNKTFRIIDGSSTPLNKFVVTNTGATTINNNIASVPSVTSGIVSNASLYVYNSDSTASTTNHSTIVNQIFGTSATNKVVYSLGVGTTATLTGWSIYRTGNSNDIRFNNTWDATAGTNNANDKLVILNSGNVGIGKTDPGHTLHVQGTLNVTNTVSITGTTETALTGYTVNIGGTLGVSKDISAFASDIRLKNVISKINNPLNIVNKLSGFYYKFNEIAQEYNLDPDNKTHVGVSAQDVQSVLPEIVEMAPFDSSNLPCGERVSRSGQNYLTIKYDKLTPVLIEAVKELQNQIETQNNIINNQNTIITEMKDSIEYLKKEIDTLKQLS
jgi:hypothetical protein